MAFIFTVKRTVKASQTWWRRWMKLAKQLTSAVNGFMRIRDITAYIGSPELFFLAQAIWLPISYVVSLASNRKYLSVFLTTLFVQWTKPTKPETMKCSAILKWHYRTSRNWHTCWHSTLACVCQRRWLIWILSAAIWTQSGSQEGSVVFTPMFSSYARPKV